MLHRRAPGRPVGGSGALTAALRRRLESYGGHVRLGDAVARIETRAGQVCGVLTAGGTRIDARAVLAGCHIATTLDLVGHAMDGQLGADRSRLRVGNGLGMAIRLGTTGLPCYPGAPPQVHNGLVLAAPDRLALRRAYGRYLGGETPDAPPVVVMAPSALDPTIAPPDRHNITVWGQWHPYRLAGGTRWEDVGEQEGDKLVAAIERIAPGFAATVEHRHVQTPLDLERELDLRHGNVMHLEMGLDAMFAWRPLPDMAGYRGPLDVLVPVRRVNAPGWRRVRGQRTQCRARATRGYAPQLSRCRPSRGPGKDQGCPHRRSRRDAGEDAVVTQALTRTTATATRTKPRTVTTAAPALAVAIGRAVPAALTVGVVAAQIAYPLVTGDARAALTISTVVAFFCACVLHALATRGPGWTARWVAVAGGTGLLVEVLATRSGVPFGSYEYSDALGPTLLGVPAVIPLAWTMMSYPALLAARRVTGRRWGQVLVGAVALAAWDVFLDPQMAAEGYWRWAPSGPAFAGIPLVNFAGWLVTAAVMMALLSVLVPPATARQATTRSPSPCTCGPTPVRCWPTRCSSAVRQWPWPAGSLWACRCSCWSGPCGAGHPDHGRHYGSPRGPSRVVVGGSSECALRGQRDAPAQPAAGAKRRRARQRPAAGAQRSGSGRPVPACAAALRPRPRP